MRTTPLRAVAALVALIVLAACGGHDSAQLAQARRITSETGGLGDVALARLETAMGHASLTLAQRFDPAPHSDLWGRPAAWRTLELGKAPDLGIGALNFAEAAKINAALPALDPELAPAHPFFLRASAPEKARAELCLTQAVYYEAALEPREGQEAVAQIVLNRLRHPDFPKSVCGVVYQGASSPGCQFSFACDGSMILHPPIQPYWDEAKAVAEAALDGFVQPSVGSATHYHADYVFPRWGPQMVKIVQLGAHIFYRYPGPLGAAQILNGRYAGGELRVSMAGPPMVAILAAKAAADAAGVPVQATSGAPARLILTSAPAATPGGHARVSGVLPAGVLPGAMPGGRRTPTPQEVAQINARLAIVGDGPIATAGADARPAPMKITPPVAVAQARPAASAEPPM